MKIISDFKDYYDSVQAYGQDPNLVYFRKTERIKLGPNDPKRPIFKAHLRLLESLPCISAYENANSQYFVISYPILVCFCGRAYPVEERMYLTYSVIQNCKDFES